MPPPLSSPPPAAMAAVPWSPLGEARALPRLWPGFTQACGALAGRAWPVAIGQEGTLLHLRTQAPAAWHEAIALRLRWHGHEGELALDAVAQALCLGDDTPADAPLAWRQILLADGLHGAARALLGTAPEWEPMAAPWPRDANTLWCALGDRGHARLRWATAEAWAAFAQGLAGAIARQPAPAAPARTLAQRLARCLIPLRLELGRTQLDLTSLHDIRPGDIVAVDEWRPRGGGLGVQLYAGRRGEAQWAAEVRQNRLTVLTSADAMNAPSTSSQTPSQTPATVAATKVPDPALPLPQLDRLEVTLHFDLGGLALSLEALERVAAGQVLELPQALNQCELNIVCQERVLGRGQLVAVGERLGVRVTEFAVSGHAAPA